MKSLALQKTQREHDKKRSKERAGSVKQVRFSGVDERNLFDALLEQNGESAVGIFRKWIAEKLVV